MKTIVIATVTAAALLTGCAGVPTDTASLRDSAAQPFRFVAGASGLTGGRHLPDECVRRV